MKGLQKVMRWFQDADDHGRPQGGQNGHSPPLEIGTKKQKFLENVKVILIILVNSCNDSLFANMTLALHKSQVHCFGNTHLRVCTSLMSAPLPAEAGCETRERIVLLLAFVA